MQALAIGPFDHRQAESLADAASRAGMALDTHASLRSLRRGEVGDAPACVLAAGPDVADVASWVRSRQGWFNVPVVALVPRADDRVYRTAFAAGADDAVVSTNAPAIERRLNNLHSHDAAAKPPAEKGVALVAAAEVAERQHLGRILRHAGFDVIFACEARELMGVSQRRPTLVVATAGFPPLGGEAAIRTVRTATQQPDMPSIVLDSQELGEHGPVPTDTRGALLFFADEAMRCGEALEQRASRRLHHATLCAYRGAGDPSYTHGLTHDISREGLFVRTLDPPQAKTSLWLELRTPQGRPVHLRGEVVWQRHPSQIGPTAPPGFGFRVAADECPPLDLRDFLEGYETLLRAPTMN